MKKLATLLLLSTLLFTLVSYTQVDSTQVRTDSSYVKTDTLKEIEITAKKELRIMEVLEQTRKKQRKQPGQKSISDVIGSKTTDYIMHPFAIKDRKKERRQKKAQEALDKLDAAQTYEDELTNAINQQLREDSIAKAKAKGQ